MKLEVYLKRKKITQAEFATRLGVQPATVTRWIGGSRRPAWVFLEAIHKATKGQVVAKDFFELNTKAVA